MTTHAFQDILERAQKLSGRLTSQTPSVNRNLQQVMDASETLWKKTANIDDSKFVPSRLSSFPNDPVSIPKFPETLIGFKNSPRKRTVLPQLGDESDLEAWLRNEEERSLLSAVDEACASSFEEVQRRHHEGKLAALEQLKKKLLSVFPSTMVAQDVPKPPTPYEVFRRTTATNVGYRRTPMSDLELSYAQQIEEYVVQPERQRKKLSDMFFDMARASKDHVSVLLWNQVRFILDLPIQSITVSSRADLPDVRTSPYFSCALIGQSLHYLEKQYRDHMQAVVQSNVLQAKLGGVPGIHALINAYLNIRMPTAYASFEDGPIGSHPVWAVLYCCLRAGELRAALEVCEDSGLPLSDYAAVLAELIEKGAHARLSQELETKLRLHYQRSVKQSLDPYKRIVVSVLAGGCDITAEHSDVCEKLEDWLWYRLWQARFGELLMLASDESTDARRPSAVARTRLSGGTPRRLLGSPAGGTLPHDTLTLAALQKMIVEEYGETHFLGSGGAASALSYFSALLLCGHFELAVEFMLRQATESFRAHAMHVALAANQCGVLLVVTHEADVPQQQTKLCVRFPGDPPGLLRLNLARIVLQYVGKFESTDMRDCLNYLFLLKDLKNESGESFFLASVSDVALRTKEFDVLFGVMDEKSGCRRRGLLDRFELHYNVQRLTESVAQVVEARGMTEYAVQLYDLAGKHTQVLELLSRLISTQLASTSASAAFSTANRLDRVATLATNIGARYKESGNTATAQSAASFFLLLDLLTFFDLYRTLHFSDALELIRRLRVIPLRSDDVEGFIRNFHLLDDDVRVLLPQLLLAVLYCVKALYDVHVSERQAAKTTLVDVSAARAASDAQREFREQAQAVLLYAGRIPCRMAGDVNARLIELESSIR